MPAAEPARVRDGLPTDAECVLFTPVPVTLPSERMPWPRLPVVRCRRAGSGRGRQRSADHRADGRIEHMLGEPEDLLDPSVAAAGDQNQAESADVNHERLLGDRPEEQHPWQRRKHSDAGRDDPRPGGRDDLATRVLPCWWARAPAPRGSKARRERRRCSGGAPSRPPACTEAGSLPRQLALHLPAPPRCRGCLRPKGLRPAPAGFWCDAAARDHQYLADGRTSTAPPRRACGTRDAIATAASRSSASTT